MAAPTRAKLRLDPQSAALRTDRAGRRDERDEFEMPWIWQVLRQEVYARLPRYEEPKRFVLVFSPVVVKSQTDTVPGLGVAGDF